MKELVNFIPKTFAECKSLLARIKGQTSATVEDRYQGVAELDEEEIKALVALLEAQIGETTAEHAPAPEAPAEEAPASEEAKAEEEAPKEAPKKVAPKKSVKK